MNRLTQISLKNSAAVLILSIILILGGVYSATTLRVESMPDITFPYLVVSATYPASPSDVLDQVTKPIEKTIAGMDGVRNVVSYSTDNFAQVVVELDQDQNPEQFKTDAESALAAAGLPPSADLRVFTEGFSTIPVYYMSIVADESVTGEELNRIYKEQIEPDLLALDGIDHLEAVGAREAVVSIRLDAEALQEHGLDTVDANTALGFPVDARSFDAAADVLHALGVHRVGLLTHNPGKVAALRARGLQVRPLPLPLAVTEHNDRYLRTKRGRLGHLLGTTTA